jgi:Skp family chaperone for outer membrane proteins
MVALLGLFTGSDKWMYIALLVLGATCVSLGSLSVSLYGDKRELAIQLDTAKVALKSANEKHQKVVEVLEDKRDALQTERDELSNNLAKVEALSEKLQLEAKQNAALGVKKQKELEKQYDERIKRFEERIKNVQDYGESDSSIVDSAGI